MKLSILFTRTCRLLLLQTAILLTLNYYCSAGDSKPTLKELKLAHQQLREDSESVQGKYRIYRIEEIESDAFEKTPEELGIPLKSEGYLWRSKQRFRADYKYYNDFKGIKKETQMSLAKDGHRIYIFRVADPGITADSLFVYDLKATEAKGEAMSVEVNFFHNIDSLWSSSGVPLADFLKEPGSKIVLDNASPAGAKLSLLVPTRDKYSLDVVLEKQSPYAFKHIEITPAKGMKYEKRVEYSEQNGIIVPSRITVVSSFGGGRGYTEVVFFELEPLAGRSPIAKDFDESSFKDPGKQCLVQHFKEPEGWTKRQYNILHGHVTGVLAAPTGSGNFDLLWMGAVAVLVFLV